MIDNATTGEGNDVLPLGNNYKRHKVKTHAIGFEFHIAQSMYEAVGEQGFNGTNNTYELEEFAYTLIDVVVEKHGGTLVQLNTRFIKWESIHEQGLASYFMCALFVRCNDSAFSAIKAELGIK